MQAGDNDDARPTPRGGTFEGLPHWIVLTTKTSVTLIALALVYLLLDFLRTVYTDWLWFNNLGFLHVYTTKLYAQLLLYIIGFTISAAALYFTYRTTWRTSWGPTVLPLTSLATAWIKRSLIVGAAVLGFTIVLNFASALADRWESFLRFWNSTSFGIADPQFGNDVGFYVFTLPMLHMIQGWLLGLSVVILVTTTGFYLLIYSARGISPVINDQTKRHLAIVGSGLMITIAAGHFLDTYETLFSPMGAVTGSTYADVNARIPGLYLLTAIALLAATLMIVTLRVSNLQQSFRIIIAAFALWAAAALILGLAWPFLVQRFAVEPSEFQRERPYIERNIEWTRRGFDLNQLNQSSYEVRDDTLARDIAANPETINNIRLWDPRPLARVYNQIQHLRLYYDFLDVDVDRYRIDGEYRQVLLGTRELFQHGLDDTAQNWVNRKLIYTHGYGVVMATATDFTPAGQPNLVLQDVPVVGRFDIDEPRVFYGESFGWEPNAIERAALGDPDLASGEVSDDEVIVNTKEAQFDRPADDPNSLPIFIDFYEGEGGVSLSSFFRRIMHGWEFEDLNFIFSRDLKPESRVMYRRGIANRVSTVAPWLELDDDPYMVVTEGRLMWIQDAYITTDKFPYSRIIQVVESSGDSRASRTAFERPLNYIRNNVKVVVDAFNGTMTFYTIEVGDEPDPILSMWRNTFPSLFTSIEDMPPALRDHIRYPEELLEAQADAFLQYHMTDAREFFLKEDQWELGEEMIGSAPTGDELNERDGRRIVDPYYVIMKLPDGVQEEFVLILPFTPQDKPNLVAWMAARSDGDHYGDVTVFEFPTDRIFHGPAQVEARIDNDPIISEQFTLWDQSGSRVIRGNLLVIPIGESLLYAEPIYLQADALAFPELKRVILATNDKVVMAESLDAAIQGILKDDRLGRSANNELPVDKVPAKNWRTIVDELRVAVESLRGDAEGLDQSLRALEELAEEAGT